MVILMHPEEDIVSLKFTALDWLVNKPYSALCFESTKKNVCKSLPTRRLFSMILLEYTQRIQVHVAGKGTISPFVYLHLQDRTDYPDNDT